MKKLFLVLALAFASILSANAQVWIGGSTNANINKAQTAFNIAPEVGYCIPNSKWSIAVAADYTFQKYAGVDATHGLILSPYVRYTVCSVEKFAVSLDLTGDFDVLSNEFGYRVGIQPCVAWMATKHWTAAFRFAFIGYNHCSYYHDLGYGDGFVMKFATAAPGFGLYYNF